MAESSPDSRSPLSPSHPTSVPAHFCRPSPALLYVISRALVRTHSRAHSRAHPTPRSLAPFLPRNLSRRCTPAATRACAQHARLETGRCPPLTASVRAASSGENTGGGAKPKQRIATRGGGGGGSGTAVGSEAELDPCLSGLDLLSTHSRHFTPCCGERNSCRRRFNNRAVPDTCAARARARVKARNARPKLPKQASIPALILSATGRLCICPVIRHTLS
eukprot:4854258-Pleurochrysis_carterae.AAC.1